MSVKAELEPNLQETKAGRTGIPVWARKIIGQRYLQAMALLGVAWMIIFNYIPMYGIIIAFKDYDIIRPVSAAPWVGLEHFRELFEDENLKYVLKNTIGMSLIKL